VFQAGIHIPTTIKKLNQNLKMKTNQMTIAQRIAAPTPKFFKVLRTIGLVLAAAGGTVLASPIALPVAITSIASYLTVAAGVLTAVSQVTVDEEALKAREGLRPSPGFGPLI
jgi:lipopolysaccharide/colanic/teichoic acid biosynthesis glycosyltransferase